MSYLSLKYYRKMKIIINIHLISNMYYSSITCDIPNSDDETITKMYNGQSNILYICIWKKNDIIHRDNNLPAYIEYYDSGKVREEMWYQKGKLDRSFQLPALVEYYENGKIKKEEWYQNGNFYRNNDLPASIAYYESGQLKEEIPYVNGKIDSIWKGYYESGQLKYERPYVNLISQIYDEY
jgi:antitoxin component YwqK of YwqJK toxin-antitoxin module